LPGGNDVRRSFGLRLIEEFHRLSPDGYRLRPDGKIRGIVEITDGNIE